MDSVLASIRRKPPNSIENTAFKKLHMVKKFVTREGSLASLDSDQSSPRTRRQAIIAPSTHHDSKLYEAADDYARRMQKSEFKMPRPKGFRDTKIRSTEISVPSDLFGTQYSTRRKLSDLSPTHYNAIVMKAKFDQIQVTTEEAFFLKEQKDSLIASARSKFSAQRQWREDRWNRSGIFPSEVNKLRGKQFLNNKLRSVQSKQIPTKLRMLKQNLTIQKEGKFQQRLRQISSNEASVASLVEVGVNQHKQFARRLSSSIWRDSSPKASESTVQDATSYVDLIDIFRNKIHENNERRSQPAEIKEMRVE